MSLWIILLILLLLFVFLCHPSLNYKKVEAWRTQRFAHRGLHDAENGIIENTLPAFRAACEKGYGIELDIQFSKDFQVVVFHDDDLLRLTGDPRMVCELTLDELRSLRLDGVESARIPTLREVLDTVNGTAPLLIELKSGKNNARLCEALMGHLKDYRGRYVIESFNPMIVFWFRRHAPQIIRGQLVCAMKDYLPTVNKIGAFCMAGLLLNCLGRPDFVAYDGNAQRFFSPHFQRFMFHTPMAAWTVADEDLAALVDHRHEMCIFERIRPNP